MERASSGSIDGSSSSSGVVEASQKIEKQEETIVSTKFEDIPKTWLMLFEGGNQGKLISELKY